MLLTSTTECNCCSQDVTTTVFHTLYVSGPDQYGRVNGRKDGWMDERAKTEFGSNNHLPSYHMLLIEGTESGIFKYAMNRA